MGKDLLGNEYTAAEVAILEAYEALKALLDHEGLAPAVEANIRESIASLWQAINDLALTDERPDV